MRHRFAKLPALLVLAMTVFAALPALAQDCLPLPANPLRLTPFAENLDKAYELSEKGYQAFEAKDFRCAAYYNAEAFRYQPDPVLMQNVANALRQGQQYDAALRYATQTLKMNPEQPEVEAANALIAEVSTVLQSGDYVEVSLRDYDAQALVVGWTRYEQSDQPRLKRGTYTVHLERAGQPAGDESITVPKPQEVLVAPTPAAGKSSGWQFVTGLSVGGVGVALLGTTLALDLIAGSKRDDYDKLRACLNTQRPCDDGRDQADYDDLGAEITGLTNVELITLVSGSVLTAIGAGLLVWHYATVEDEPTNAISLGVVPAPGGAHVLLEMRF